MILSLSPKSRQPTLHRDQVPSKNPRSDIVQCSVGCCDFEAEEYDLSAWFEHRTTCKKVRCLYDLGQSRPSTPRQESPSPPSSPKPFSSTIRKVASGVFRSRRSTLNSSYEDDDDSRMDFWCMGEDL
ncbi:hypothetical protein CONPUDRAFT_166256 [Coniophora puteana RWD-64-598 SS2]|uniref:Uncharacterized protein n=1 Tax=Coniophora puteana (strain RWD-64-598) TaxID=741705 RepID=A0A5M3MKY7_CONPW|nr:uncharacterized protein CONPUDRAFT_166256 [Coniophora puteana RWD-64-598 SS2]EIW79484.1 hypothetical protein CONPUDRAFT_166256 [Coniophora puteana RWD-64-598 SS2]